MAKGPGENFGTGPWTRIASWAGLILGVMALGLVGWQGWDYQEQRRQMEAAISDLRQALSEVPQPGSDLEEQIELKEQALDREFPAKLDLAALEPEVQKLASGQGLALTGLEPLLARDFEGYRLQALRLTVLGSTRQMAGLVKGLADYPGIQQVRVEASEGSQEGFQHNLYWDWYLYLPGPQAKEPCPEPKDQRVLPPRQANLFLWAGGNLSEQRAAAEALQTQLAAAREQEQTACRRRARWETLRQREELAESLAQQLSQSEPELPE